MSKKIKVFHQVGVLLLSFFMLFSSIPIQVWAESVDADETLETTSVEMDQVMDDEGDFDLEEAFSLVEAPPTEFELSDLTVVDSLSAQPNWELIASGTDLTRADQGTNAAAGTTRIVEAPVGLRHAALMVEQYRTQTAANRWGSIFIELSDGSVVGVNARRQNETTTDAFDRMAFGHGNRAAAIGGGDQPSQSLGTTGFWAANAAAVHQRFPNLNLGNTAITANTLMLWVDIDETTLTYQLKINGEAGVPDSQGSVTIPAGITIHSVHAWAHTNSTLSIPLWEFWDTTPQEQLTEPPTGVPEVTASGGVTRQVGLAWQAVPLAEWYEVSYREWPNGVEAAPIRVEGLTHALTGLTDGIAYEFFVRAVNEAGPAVERGSVIATPSVTSGLLNLRGSAWFETVYAQWTARPGDRGFDVFVSLAGADDWTQVNAGIHAPLVRLVDSQAATWRVDVPGLRATGSEVYDLRIVAVPSGVTDYVYGLAPTPFMRTGAAFENGGAPGGYNLDGTVPDDAQIVYVTHENMNTVLTSGLLTGTNANNRNTTPTIVRFLGTVGRVTETNLHRPDPGVPAIATNANMVQTQWRNNITFEGIGPDAVIYGWGLQLTDTTNVEVRNLTFDYYFEDGVWVQRAEHVWLHHNAFTYGQNQYAAGGEDDKAMGDGASDIVNSSRNWTIGFNVYRGSDKTMLVGGNNNIGDAVGRGTIHHNFFDQTDARHPRVRFAEVHVFNNVYVGTTGYGIGAGSLARIIAEGNYFRDANRPIIMHGQGHAGSIMGQDASGVIITNHAPGMANALEANAFHNVSNFDPATDLRLERLTNGLFRSPISNTRRHPENANPITGSITTEFYQVRLWHPDRAYVQTAADAYSHVRAHAGTMAVMTYHDAPVAPAIEQISIHDDETFTISWTPLLDARRYTLQWDGGVGNWEELMRGHVTSYTTRVTAVEGQTYQFRVLASNSIGSSDWSEEATIVYMRPSAPTNLTIAPAITADALQLSWDAPLAAPAPSSFDVVFTQVEDRDSNPVDDEKISASTGDTHLTVNGLAVGKWRVEIFSRVGQLTSTPLAETTQVDPWYLDTTDLLLPVLTEDFSDFALGEVRGIAAQTLGASVLRQVPTHLSHQRGMNFPPTPGEHTALHPVLAGMTGLNNDLVITASGRNGSQALKLQDFAPGNNVAGDATGEYRQFGTFMFLELEDEIRSGRVIVELDYRVLRNTTGNGITPIRLYDAGGTMIMSRAINHISIVEGGQSGIALPGHNGPWRHAQIVLDFDLMVFDLYFDGYLVEFSQPIPSEVTGLKTISANTPTGNQGGSPSQLSLYFDQIEVRVPGEGRR